MKAMILAAGFGTRMRPLTDTIPKPLIAVSGRTLIDRALDGLEKSGIKEVVVNSHYKAELLEKHLKNRASPHIIISHETDILETGGGIKNALPLLGDAPFICINSDTIVIDGKTPAIQHLQAAWDESTMDALLLVHPVSCAVGYDGAGDFFMDNGALCRRLDTPSAPYVFTGVQLIHPRLFDGAPDGAFSMNVLYNKGMDDDGHLPRIRGLVHDGAWLHVGDPAGLKQAEDFLALRA